MTFNSKGSGISRTKTDPKLQSNCTKKIKGYNADNRVSVIDPP